MNPVGKVFQAFSSREFLIWLIGGWLVYYVTTAIWSQEAFAHFISDLGSRRALQVPYVVFLFGLLLNIIRGVGLSVRRRGYVSAFFKVFLPVGILVFLTGFFMSATMRQSSQLLTGEGDQIKPAWVKRGYFLKEIKPALKDETLDTEGELGRVFTHEPQVVLERQGREFNVGVFPPVNIEGTYYHILNFGIAPGVVLRKEDTVDKKGRPVKGELVDEGYMALRILPPGAQDKFRFQDQPYDFSLSIAPGKVVKKGPASVNVYSLKDPLYNVRVYRAGREIFSGNSRDGITFDGLTLTFFKPTYWLILDIARDPGYPVLLAGMLLLALGLPLRLLGALTDFLRG